MLQDEKVHNTQDSSVNVNIDNTYKLTGPIYNIGDKNPKDILKKYIAYYVRKSPELSKAIGNIYNNTDQKIHLGDRKKIKDMIVKYKEDISDINQFMQFMSETYQLYLHFILDNKCYLGKLEYKDNQWKVIEYADDKYDFKPINLNGNDVVFMFKDYYYKCSDGIIDNLPIQVYDESNRGINSSHLLRDYKLLATTSYGFHKLDGGPVEIFNKIEIDENMFEIDPAFEHILVDNINIYLKILVMFLIVDQIVELEVDEISLITYPVDYTVQIIIISVLSFIFMDVFRSKLYEQIYKSLKAVYDTYEKEGFAHNLLVVKDGIFPPRINLLYGIIDVFAKSIDIQHDHSQSYSRCKFIFLMPVYAITVIIMSCVVRILTVVIVLHMIVEFILVLLYKASMRCFRYDNDGFLNIYNACLTGKYVNERNLFS